MSGAKKKDAKRKGSTPWHVVAVNNSFEQSAFRRFHVSSDGTSIAIIVSYGEKPIATRVKGCVSAISRDEAIRLRDALSLAISGNTTGPTASELFSLLPSDLCIRSENAIAFAKGERL